LNDKHFGFWELYRKGPNGTLEFRKINRVFQDNSKSFIILSRKNNEVNEFLLNKTSGREFTTIKAQFRAIGNELHVYFDNSYRDVILKIEKNDGKVLKVIDNTNGLGLL